MVKLVRMVADRTKSITEIVGIFNPPFTLEPNSRVALQLLGPLGDGLILADNETFDIDSTNNAMTVDGVSITLTSGTYTLPEFIDEIKLRITLNAGNNNSNRNGSDYNVELKDGKMVITKYVTRNASFVEWDDYTLIDGSPNLTADGEYDGQLSADCVVLSNFSVPNASWIFNGLVDTVGQFNMSLNDFGSDLFRLGINDAGDWEYETLSGVVDTGISANPSDDFAITRNGSVVTFAVGNDTFTHTVTDAEQTILNESFLTEHAFTSNNSGVILVELGETLLDEKPTALRSKRTSLSVTFGSEALAFFCGFDSVGPHKNTGDPAIVSGTNPVKGKLVNPGVIVTLDPLILETYDGDHRNTRFRGQSNILAVLSGKTFNRETISPPLDIRNTAEVTINQLRMSFRNQANGNSLEFNGEPYAVLLFYGPNERF